MTWTVTRSGSVWVALPVTVLSVPPAGGLAAIALTMHVLAAGEPPLGIGSGGPNRQPGAEQLRLLPVSTEVAAASVKALLTLHWLTLRIVVAPSGVGEGGCAEAPPPM